MPLLNNKPFEKIPIPENLKLDDEVFYCQITDEVFVDYEKFFERIILCNSLVWTCSMSGKSGLTFGEARSAERFIESQIKPLVYALKRPLLYLVTLTHRKNVNDLVDELYNHVRGRFFVGETVEAQTDAGVKKSYKVLKIMWPNKNQDKKSLENGQSDSKSRSNSPSKRSSPTKTSPVKNTPTKNEVHKDPHAELIDGYEYAIQEISEQITSVRILLGSKISRPRNIFTKERLRVFLKMNCEVDQNEKIWKVKENAITQYKLKSATYESISPGPAPVFGLPVAKKSHSENDDGVIDLTDDHGKSPKKSKKQTSDAPAKSSANGESQKIKEAKMKARKDMQKVEDELKQMREIAAEKKKKQLEEKMENRKMEKAKKLEEKKKQKEDQIEWSKQREDLECEDHKDMPVGTPISCPGLSEERFGDLVVVTEFISAFHSTLNLHLPKNFTLVKLNEALNEKVVDGTYGDLLVSIMSALFSFGKESVDADDSEELADFNKAYKQVLATFGTTLTDLQLDVYTVSEIVRIYLSALPLSQFNNNNNDGGSSKDRTSFVDELAEKSIYDMRADDKLQVLYILVHQLLMCYVVRTQIEETLDSLKVAQRNLKSHQLSCTKREKDEIQYWSKKKQEQRFKSLLTGEPVANSDEKSGELEPQLEMNNKVSTRANNNQSIPDEKFENLPTENFDWSKITPYEKQQMKLWESKTEKALMQQISKFQVGFPVALGFDRTHRRYWKFTCLPGIFVEDYEDEVSGFTVPSPVKQRVLSPSRNRRKENVKSQEGEKSDKENVPFCSQADLSSSLKCPTMTVHEQLTKKGLTRWSYYDKVEQIDLLMTSLNVRGLREFHLLTTIKEYYQSIVSSLAEAEEDLLSDLAAQSASDSNDRVETDEDSVVGSGEAELEAGMKETILDLEERIFVGALGKLKNIDREKWRNDIENGHYDNILQILPVSSDSSSSAKRNKRYDGLVSALLQIEKMVERRFINFEMEVDKKSKKQSKKKDISAVESDDDSSSTSSHNAKMWEANIQTVTSLSQLFLFMSIIDSSVTWSKSALNARCCICRRKGDGENMLLCDNCDKGHHTYCLKPPVKNIPEGDWFCPKCRPKNQTKRVAKEKLKIDDSVEENNSETKDYEHDQLISEEEDDDDEGSGSNEGDSSDEKPTAKQLIVNKRFYSKKKSGKVASTSSLSSVGQSNVSLQKRSSSNTRRNTRNSNQSSKRQQRVDDDDDDDGDARSLRGKRERNSLADPPVKKRGAFSMGSKDINLSQVPMKSCENLITELMNNENSWPFLRPVSKKEVPDYFDVVKNPMDFSRIRNKIHSFEYRTTEDIVGDVRLIFSNCKLYNQPSSCFYEAADKLSAIFEEELGKLATNSSHSSFRGRHSKESYVQQESSSRKRRRIQESESEDERPSRTLRKRN